MHGRQPALILVRIQSWPGTRCKVQEFMEKPLDSYYPYLFVDASYFKVLDGTRYVNKALLVISESGLPAPVVRGESPNGSNHRTFGIDTCMRRRLSSKKSTYTEQDYELTRNEENRPPTGHAPCRTAVYRFCPCKGGYGDRVFAVPCSRRGQQPAPDQGVSSGEWRSPKKALAAR